MRKKFAVIGLGHFGMNLSLALTNLGADVLAIDNQENHVELLRDRVAHAVIADCRDQEALRGLGLEDFDAVILAIGEDFESSILATANLQEIGVKNIVNRVVSPTHEKLLKVLKVDHLILPEKNAALQLANKLIRKGVLEYLELSDDFSIVEIKTPKEFVGVSLGDIELRKTYNINLITIIRKRERQSLLSLAKGDPELEVLGVPDSNYVLGENDIMVVFGSKSCLKKIIS